MLKSISIKNFRGIQRCSIDDFADVNAFLGRNGSGKSTILESIYLASDWAYHYDKLHKENKVTYIILRRTGRGNWTKSRDVLWFGMDTNREVEINLTFTSGAKMIFSLFNFDSEGHTWLKVPDGLRMRQEYDYCNISIWSFLSKKTKSQMEIPIDNKNKLTDRYGKVIEFLENVTLIDTKILMNPKLVEDFTWAKILSKRLDKHITKMIREGFESDAEDITYMPIGGTNVLALKLSNTTVRIDDLGDGARNAVMIASILLTLNNTAVLIEEPENNQHPGGLKTLIEFILKSAKERKLQIFLSTHSIETFRILDKLCDDIGLRLKTFFLERNKDGLVDVRSMERVDVDTLIKLGLDPRFLNVM